jgi:hypothetical protein
MRSFSNTKGAIAGLALTIVLSLAAMPATAVAAEGLRFMVFGDAPYPHKGNQIEILKETVAPAILNAKFSFLIHLGDMKSGRES